MKKIAIYAALMLGIVSIAGAQGAAAGKPMTKQTPKMTSTHKSHHMTSHKHGASHKHGMTHKHSMSTMKHGGTMHPAPKPPTKKK